MTQTEIEAADRAEAARLRDLLDWLLVEAECDAVHSDLDAAGLLPQSETPEDTHLPWHEWADNLAA